MQTGKTIASLIPKVKLITGVKDPKYKGEFYKLAENIFRDYYKDMASYGCEMGWQGLDEELSTLDQREYIEQNRGFIYLLYDNKENTESKLSEAFIFDTQQNDEIQQFKQFDQIDILNKSLNERSYVMGKENMNSSLNQDQIIGCIALRELPDYKKEENKDTDISKWGELKRMYVKPEYRKSGYGQLLTQILLKDAQQYGYNRIFLDSLERLPGVDKLYKKCGFYHIPQYNVNPEKDAIYMVKDFSIQK